ncbi:hypothetical protein [Natrinema sp. 1APR25-10V2]|uniref:hypothetical protein n=1 Tax=Natrinema sp. 1APR25-10V2 TaxID=2951081 RepID=UPI002875E127|nr:hypothetical protein [Natrinema sp. 1APR25-10V2]MDS0478387.1 hypothetical protein [Natrinema sp. 1APR25-10V2]
MSLGMLMGLWIMYPNLLPGYTSDSHPLGYAIVLSTPLFVGYILWKDARPVFKTVLQDQVARRFGIGVGFIMALFFISTTGYMSFILEDGGPREVTIAVMSVRYQLVMWPTLEVLLPEVPLFFAISIGVITVVGLLSVLVGLNAALIARYWRAEEQAGIAENTTKSAAILGTCTCGCCGPLVSQIVLLAAGPTVAAPVYWVFVDAASPFTSIFIISSILLFTGTLVYSVESARLPTHTVPNSSVSAD